MNTTRDKNRCKPAHRATQRWGAAGQRIVAVRIETDIVTKVLIGVCRAKLVN